jgi:hypothetical protein
MKINKKLTLTIILFVQLLILACSTLSQIDPEDERLEEPIQNMIENWEEFFGDFGGSSQLSAPYIEYLYPTGNVDLDSGKWEYHITLTGRHYNYVGIFEVKPTGCGKNGQASFELLRLNATFSTGENFIHPRISEEIYVHPGTFLTVAGTNNLEKYGKYNELLRLAAEEEIWTPILNSPQLNQSYYPREISFSGNAYPGMCLELVLNEELVDWKDVSEDGRWDFSVITLLDGENQVQIQAKNVDEKTARPIMLSMSTYAPPQPYDPDAHPVVKSEDMPNFWSNIKLEDIPVRSFPGQRDPETTIAIIHQFQVENTDDRHRARYVQGVGHSSWRCNIFAGDVLSALSIPFPTKKEVNCCGGGSMWVGPELMYDFMSGSPRGISNIRRIWPEWGKWELVYDAQDPSRNQYQKLLDHLRSGKPAIASRPDHIAVLRTDNLPEFLNDTNVLDLFVAQAGDVNRNKIKIREVFRGPGSLRIFIHE